MSVPTFSQEQRRKDRADDLRDILDALKFLGSQLDELRQSLNPEEDGPVDEWLADVERAAASTKEAVNEYIELADYEPDYKALAEGCERMVESVRMGLFDEPKSVPEFAMNLADLMRDTQTGDIERWRH